MQISFVSSSIENLPRLENLQGNSIHKVAKLDELLTKKIKLDLVFFDAKLGEENILQQIKLYQQEVASIKWFIIHLNNIQQALYYIKKGASGIITGFYDKEMLLQCILASNQDWYYLDESLVQILALRQIKKILIPFDQLTAREFDVFCLLAEDYSIQEIAGFLSIATKTVFNCQSQLRKKLALESQQQIRLFAKKNRLII
jgi:DNA-binding NarL/FixJ family response regulator